MNKLTVLLNWSIVFSNELNHTTVIIDIIIVYTISPNEQGLANLVFW